MMSLDDVVVRTVGLLVLTGIAGGVAWTLLPDGGPTVTLALIGSAIVGLVLGLVISFKQITNPFVIGAYAVVEGVLLGVISRYFEARFPGIVIQAVVGTFGVFFGMAILYKFRVLRATPKFARFVIGALIGVVALMVINLVLGMFGINMGIRAGETGEVGALPIIFSIIVIGVGALTFILDFDMIEKGVQYGLPEKFAWYCAFGLLVGLIFLYIEILRLLSYLRR
jgi:uncharacterized YccA/Bax inhibitor family protein